jgi:mRNA-degrading endonuclease RelE of RelBE toxin-antitoxin system
MSTTISQIVFHKEIRTIDLPAFEKRFESDANGFNECWSMIENELRRIQKSPEKMGKKCEYEPLSSEGFRKTKFFSKKSSQHSSEKPDLRIIYHYDQTKNEVKVLTIGFRINKKPRPKDDPYSVASNRPKLW